MANRLTNEYANPDAIKAFEVYFDVCGYSLFDYDFLDHNIQSLYEVPQKTGYLLLAEFCRKIGDPNRIKKCVVEFIDSPHYLAYAATHNGYYFVAISSAIPILTQALFQNLVNSTNPFSDEDSVQDEVHKFPNSFYSYKSNADIESLLISAMPPERWQKILSTKLAEIAVVFCLSHEISHLVRGHALLCGIKNMRPLGEVRGKDNERADISDRLSQAWELQADKTAIAFMYSYVMNNENYRGRLLDTLMCRRSNEPEIELMSRVMYAVSFVLFLFGQEQRDVRTTGAHPSSITRQTFIMAHIVSMLSSPAVGCGEELAESRIKKTAELAEKAWNRAGFQFGDFSEKIEDLTDTVKDLDRAEHLCQTYLRHHQWAAFIR